MSALLKAEKAYEAALPAKADECASKRRKMYKCDGKTLKMPKNVMKAVENR